MRGGIVLAAALIVFSATGVRADQWCGYASRDDAVIECGYTTADHCESAVGKGGMRFVDPDLALDTRPPSRLYVFIESKNSPLFLVLRSLSSRKSMASIVPIGLRMRRSTYIFLS
jgi:hypothetical protein